MHSKPRLTAADPHCLGMSDQARAVLERGQRAFRERQAQMNQTPGKPATAPQPAAQAPKRETADDVAVRVAIESAKAERQKREQAQLHRLTILAQVAGVHINEVAKLLHD